MGLTKDHCVREGRQGRGSAGEVTGEAPGVGVGKSQD